MKITILSLLLLYINVNLIYSTKISIRYINKSYHLWYHHPNFSIYHTKNSSFLYHDKWEKINQKFTYRIKNLNTHLFDSDKDQMPAKMIEWEYDEAYFDKLGEHTNKSENPKKNKLYHIFNFIIRFILELAYILSITKVFYILDISISNMLSLNLITMSCVYMEIYKHFLFRIAVGLNCCLFIRLEYNKEQEVAVAERIDENIIQSTEEDEIILVPLVTEVNI